MIRKQIYQEKQVDLALNYNELYRTTNHEIGFDQMIREFHLSSESDLQHHLFLAKLLPAITHPNLLAVHSFMHQDHYEDYLLEEAKDIETAKFIKRAKLLESEQSTQLNLLQELLRTTDSGILPAPKDITCFEDLRLPLTRFEEEHEQRKKQQQQAKAALHLHPFSNDSLASLIKKQTSAKLADLKELKQTDARLTYEAQRRHKFTLRIATENVESTLSTELLRRIEINLPFQFAEIQSFLREAINLFAGLEFHNQEIRDIYPYNIFLTDSDKRTEFTQRYLFGVSQEYLKLYHTRQEIKQHKQNNMTQNPSALAASAESVTKNASSTAFSFSKLFAKAVGYLAPELKEAYFKGNYALSKGEFSQYKAGVFSLGLIGLYLSTMQDPWGLNFPNDTTITKKLKILLKLVSINHSNNLAKLLEKMLDFNHATRKNFLELDNCEELKNYLAEDQKFLKIQLTFDDLKDFKHITTSSQLAPNRTLNESDTQTLKQFAEQAIKLDIYDCENKSTSTVLSALFKQNPKQISQINILKSQDTFDSIFPSIISAQLRCPILKLELLNTNVSLDQFYFICEQLQQIKSLRLAASQITYKHIVILAKQSQQAFQHLKHFDLSSNREITDAGFAIILQIHLPELKTLNLGGPVGGCGLSLQSLRHIYQLGQKENTHNLISGGNTSTKSSFYWKLKKLDLSWNNINEEGIKYIAQHYNFYKHISTINLSKCQFLPEELNETMSYSTRRKLHNVQLE